MKDLLSRLNKTFENRVRLGIMSLLMVNDTLDFNTLRETLNLTDGNLASHAAALEEKGYIAIFKSFSGKKTLTIYQATANGKTAFKDHLDALEQLIKGG